MSLPLYMFSQVIDMSLSVKTKIQKQYCQYINHFVCKLLEERNGSYNKID